jgi:PAS domain S-box-containing protein
VVRNRMPGGVGGRREQSRLLPDMITLMVIQGGVALWANNKLANLNEQIFKHPFTVSNEVMEVDSHIISMHRYMKDVVLASNIDEINRAVVLVDKHEKDVLQHFNIIRGRFLGDLSQINSAQEAFVAWGAIRLEVIELTKNGQHTKAAAITTGKGAQHVALLNSSMAELIEFAHNKAAQFNAYSDDLHSNTRAIHLIIFIIIIAIAGVIAFHITKKVKGSQVKLFNMYSSMFNETFTGMVLHEIIKDETGKAVDFRFLDMNSKFEELTGQRSEDLCGRTVQEMIPDLAADLIAKYNQVVKTGKSLHFDSYSPQMQKYFKICVFRVQPNQFVSIYFDTTQHQQIEIELKQNESMFRGLLNAIDDSIILFSKEYKVFWANSAAGQLFGRDVEALLGMNGAQLWSSEFKSADQLVQDCFRSGSHGVVRVSTTTSNVLDVRTFPVHQDDAHHPSHVILIITDVGERVSINEQALRTAHLATLGVLSASIAHEINNPNNIIILNAPILKQVWERLEPVLKMNMPTYMDNVNDPVLLMRDEIPRIINDISDASKRIKRIVSQLKYLVNQDTEDMSTAVDMKKTVKESITLLHHKIQQSTDSFQMNLDEELPTIFGNAQQLQQVVINLVLNSLQALPDRTAGLELTLSLNVEDKNIVFIVKDSGIGIPKDILGHIMSPLFTTRRDSGGTGLGLSTCKQIIDRHKGKIEFESQVGRGTTATITLPAQKESA